MERQASATTPSKSFRENICRTCLRRISACQAVCIFSDEEIYNGQALHQVFKEITHTLMEQNDSLPKNICQNCAWKAKQAVAFKRSIEKANLVLTANLRKAEWSHFSAVSQSLPSDFSSVLDRFCSEMAEIVDEEEPADIKHTDTSANNVKPSVAKQPVDISKVREWQAGIDNILEGRIVGIVQAINTNHAKRTESTRATKNILRPTNNNTMQKDRKSNRTDFSGKKFVEELLESQKSTKQKQGSEKVEMHSQKDPDAQNNIEPKIVDTIIIIDDDEIEETVVTDEMMVEPEDRQVVDGETISLEEKIAAVEKECSAIIDNCNFSPDSDKPVACCKCNKRFTNTAFLQRHLLYHSLDLIPAGDQTNEDQARPTHPEPSNPISTARPQQTTNTYNSVNNTKPYQTTKCSDKADVQTVSTCNFANNAQRTAEIRNLVDLYVDCQYCQEKVFKLQLRRHVRLMHKDELLKLRKMRYTCPKCNKFYRSTARLQNHIKAHDQIFKCEHCEKSFNKKRLLNQHQQGVHNIKMTSVCYICGKLISATSMPVHIRTHTLTKSIKCTVEGCHALLKYKSSLRDHLLRVHGTEKIHMCEICGKTFPMRSSLTGHIRLHSDNQPYRCDICERSFRTPGRLKLHFQCLHQRDKAYKCPVCPQVFIYKYSIRKHCGRYHPEHPLAKETPHHHKRNYVTNPAIEKTFKCSVCLRPFATEYNLKKHNRAFHPLLFYNEKQTQLNGASSTENCGNETNE